MSPVDGAATGRHYAGADAPSLPPPTPMLPPAEELLPNPAPGRSALGQAHDDAIADAFTAWLADLRGKVDDGTERLLYAAFVAGATHAEQTALRSVRARSAERRPDAPLTGTAETRTLIAALELFIDQVLAFSPEEVGAGEWLSADDARAVVAALRRGHA